MKFEKMSTAASIGYILGWGFGVLVSSVIYTYVGLTILGYLGWMP